MYVCGPCERAGDAAVEHILRDRLAARTAPARDPLEDKVRALVRDWRGLVKYLRRFGFDVDAFFTEKRATELAALLPDAVTEEVRRG